MTAPLPRLGRDPVAMAQTLRLMANADRLAILCHLSAGEASVARLQTTLGLRQPGLSQQLSELREAGMVVVRRASRTAYYSLAEGQVRAILVALDTAIAASAPPLAQPATPAATEWTGPDSGKATGAADQSAHFARLD